MCHIIRGAEGHFLDYGNFLIGIKQMRCENGVLKSIVSEKYSYKISLGRKGIVCKDKPKMQIVDFSIPMMNSYIGKYSVRTKAKKLCGMHIFPFSKYIISHSYMDIVDVFVGFKKEDVVFYDGEHISVKSFTILNPEEIKKFLSIYKRLIKRYHFKFFDNPKKWLEDYEKFFNTLKENLKKKKKR